MRIGSEKDYIELEELERNPKGTPCAGDVKLRVTLNLQEFRGFYDGIWVELPEMERFLAALDVLDAERQGIARITSMSPDEFILEIRASDELGHMEVKAQLHRYQYSGPKYWPIFLNGGFEVQPEAIRQLIACFKAFTN